MVLLFPEPPPGVDLLLVGAAFLCLTVAPAPDLGAPEDLPGDLPPLPTDVALCELPCSTFCSA